MSGTPRRSGQRIERRVALEQDLADVGAGLAIAKPATNGGGFIVIEPARGGDQRQRARDRAARGAAMPPGTGIGCSEDRLARCTQENRSQGEREEGDRGSFHSASGPSGQRGLEEGFDQREEALGRFPERHVSGGNYDDMGVLTYV